MSYLNLTGELRYDVRGLPEGYDPHQFYEYKYMKKRGEATGIEGFLYKLLPYELIKSFAVAIDPFQQLQTAPGIVTPANRKRYRGNQSIFNYRTVHKYEDTTQFHSMVNYMGLGNDGPVVYDPTIVIRDYNETLPSQPVLFDFSNDTTRRTRLFGSSVGEFEKFSHTISSPPRILHFHDAVRQDFYLNVSKTNPYPSIRGSDSTATYSYGPTGATVSLGTFNAIVGIEKNVASQLMAKHALSMFRDCNPQSRAYSLFRNIVELRDVPKQIFQLKETLLHLHDLDSILKINGKLSKIVHNLTAVVEDIPKEYLSYHFGWKQSYKDVLDLLNSPSKISKQLNLLFKRSGKPTTYRTKRVIVTSDDDVSCFDYDQRGGEYNVQIGSHMTRSSELRMVLNTTFEFPSINTPRLIEQLYIDKLGVYPRAIDIYNLVPWTWLLDWFSGMGNYLEVIENINHDQSLINWGFLTCTNTGQYQTDFRSKLDNTTSISMNQVGGDHPDVFVQTVDNHHSSHLDYVYQLRKSLSHVLDVNMTTDVETLSSYQKSILGALLAQRTDLSRISSHTG